MKLPVVYRQAARRDIVDAARWYESRRTGSGAGFIFEIARIEDHIGEAPGLYQIVAGDIRRAVLRRYPFGLFYLQEPARLLVLACLDLRQEPRTLSDLLARR